MNTDTTDRLVERIHVASNLVPFMRLVGWEQVDISNANWLVFHGERDVNGQPLELVFPKRGNLGEMRTYVIKAIDLLAVLKDEPVHFTTQRIINYDHDLLFLRNTSTDDDDAIPLGLASNQISNLKQLISYGASSEKEPRPYYQQQTSIGKKIVNDYMFGHTFIGSFGFTVEAPRLPDPPQFIQGQLSFDDSDDNNSPLINTPFERRVMERIARGLIAARDAENSRDHNILIQEYRNGFNSNMCSALVGMSNGREAVIEFRIAWSPKIQVDDELSNLAPIKLNKNAYDILDFAAAQLKYLEPTTVEITGHVKGLTASDNPQSLGTRRAVVIRGSIPDAIRPVDIIVELDRDDYREASRAHVEWASIQVDGILSRSGAMWRLSTVRNFRVIPPRSSTQ